MITIGAISGTCRVLALQSSARSPRFPLLLQVAPHSLLAHLGHDISSLEVRRLIARDEQQAIAPALIGRRAG